MRFELAQTSNYSPCEDIVNEIIYFVYDRMIYLGPAEMRMRVACLLQQALSFAWNLSVG